MRAEKIKIAAKSKPLAQNRLPIFMCFDQEGHGANLPKRYSARDNLYGQARLSK